VVADRGIEGLALGAAVVGQMPASATAASASISSVAIWVDSDELVATVVAGAVDRSLVRSVRARRQAVMPLRVRTAKPSGNASARACKAAWRSCS
jgi:hypothetical protein